MRLGELTVWNTYVNVESGLTIPELNAIIDLFDDDAVEGTAGGSIQRNVRRSKIKWLGGEHFTNSECLGIDRKILERINQVNDEFFKFDLVGMEDFQLTQYHENENGNFDFHCDSPFHQEPVTRKLSFIIPLSPLSDYEGGHLQFRIGGNLEDLNVENPDLVERGMMIVFPSHLIHAITPVTKGIRYSLVGWCHGPRFK